MLIILHLACINQIVFAEEVDNADSEALDNALLNQTIDDENWIDYGTHTLNWGDIIEVGGYYFEATDFSVGSASEIKIGEEVWALLTIYEGETPIWRNVFSAEETATYDDKIKVLCTELEIKSPYMKIQIYIKKIPKPITVEEWINKTIKVTKTIRKIAYMGERSIVHIKITNLSKVNPDKILVTDYLPVDLIVDPDQDLLWNITDSDIDDITYSIRSLKPGNYELPPAKVQLEYYGQNYIFYSNKPTIKVDGPYVVITKTASKKNISPNDTVDIKVTVKNIGNQATYVYVTDQLPANTKLVSGVLNFTTVLQPSGTNATTTNESEYNERLAQNLENLREVRVENITDNNTLIVDNSEEVRLAGINIINEIIYKESKEYVKKVLLNKTVYLDVDDLNPKDEYNRTLAVVYVDGINLNAELLKKGYAEIMYTQPSEFNPNLWIEDTEKNTTKYLKSDSTIYTNTYTIKGEGDVTLPAAVAQYVVPKQIDKYIVYRPSAPQSTEKYINPKFYSDIAKSSTIQISVQTPIEQNQAETPQPQTKNTSNVDQIQTQSQTSIENQTQSEKKVNETKNNKKFPIPGFEMFYALIVLLVIYWVYSKLT